MIERSSYFVIHSPRQSGKTTLLDALTEKINRDGKYYALQISLFGANVSEDINFIFDVIAESIAKECKSSNLPAIASLADEIDRNREDIYVFRIRDMLRNMCNALEKELIIFFDEADTIPGSAIIPFLSQIRDGYLNRLKPNKKFPKSMVLVGMIDIADYKTKVRADGYSAGTSSPFNVRRESLSLPDFSKKQIYELYGQHTAASRQSFTDGAIDRAWYWTEGQPWLVNALANLIIDLKLNYDYSRTIDGDMIDDMANDLILQNQTHFHSLAERLKEPRVLRIMDAVVSGADRFHKGVLPDDVRYCTELGLLKPDKGGSGSLRPSNPIYQEVIVRILSSGILMKTVPADISSKWTDGISLDMSGLLQEFQKHWVENGELMASDSRILVSANHANIDFGILDNDAGSDPLSAADRNVNLASLLSESFCVLVLFSFLQRVLNGGALIQREFALGRKFADIVATYKGKRYPIEVKIKGALSRRQSLDQLQGYIDRCNATEGWLVVFDRDETKTLKEKSSWEIDDSGKITKYIVNC
jgi:hypothetical protein